MTSNIYKNIACAVGALGTVGSFIIGNKIPKIDYEAYVGLKTSYNYPLVITGLVFTVLIVFTFIFMSKCLDNQESILYFLEKQDKHNTNIPSYSYNGNASSAYTNTKALTDWTCKNCGALNNKDSKFCKSCKEHI